MDAITDEAALRAHFGTVSELAERKVLPFVDGHARAFIALSPFLVLATADAEGGVDASPRGDPPGFVRVIDDVTLLVPDRPGNRRIDSYRNIVAQPGVGLIFFVPGQGKVPVTGLLVTVREMFFHCAKALIRSRLWDPQTRVERASFPSLGRIIAEQTRVMPAEEAEVRVAEGYRDKLY